MNNDKKLNNIIEALAQHEDDSAVEVLERIGTNCPDNEVRRLTAKALVSRNTPDSLAIVISQRGKGINDLSTNVAMSTINEILDLEDKINALKVLAETEENSEDELIKETAHSLRALMNFS